MTIIEAITNADNLKRNSYSQKEKIVWLNKLDGMVKRIVLDTHEGGDSSAFTGYTEHTPLSTELLIPEPFTDVYQRWLEAQIDLANGEYGKYNASITLFDEAWEAYTNDYHRKHKPIGGGRRFLF